MPDSETNPFVLFRRFADEQLAAALKSFKDPWAPLQDIHHDKSFQNRQNEIWERFEQSFQRSINPERVQIERLRDEEAQQHSLPSHIQATNDVGLQIEEGGNECDAKWSESALGDRPWSLRWFDESSYSPLILEQDPNLCKVNWRNAFEELMYQDGVHGEPDGSLSRQCRDPLLDHMSGIAWKNSLLQRGVLSDHGFWRDTIVGSPLESMFRVLGEWRSAHQTQSELDFYESISQQDGREDAAVQEPRSRPHETGAPNVLSTLTRTERMMMPDGSIHSRTILRRRFADGSEECQETSDATLPSTTPPESPQAKEEAPKQARERKNGWFW